MPLGSDGAATLDATELNLTPVRSSAQCLLSTHYSYSFGGGMSEPSAWWDGLLSDYEAKHPGQKIEELLGQGNSAAVFKLARPEGVAALKVYKPQFFKGSNEAAERYRLSLHERLKGHECRSLVKVFGVGELEESAYITMEFLPWPSLDLVLGAIPVSSIPTLIRDIAEAVRWMESNCLVHRDIKPANILISPDFSEAKLVDFGVVRATDDSAPDLTDHGYRRPFVATAQYSSPEYLFRLVEPSETLWRGLSVYQLGGVLHDMLEKRPLFNEEVLSENRYVLAMAVLRRQPTFHGREYPVAWGALARRALSKDLDIRLRAASLDQFTKLDVFDARAARQRLGLEEPDSVGIVDSANREAERKRLQLRKVLVDLEEKLGHQLQAEGYSRVRWVQQEEDSVWFLVQAASDAGCFVSFRLQAKLLDDNMQLLVGANLDSASPVAIDCPNFLWEGALDRAGAALVDEVVPLVSDLLLKALTHAADIVTLGHDDSLPMNLLERA